MMDDRINELMAPLSQYDLSIIIEIFSSVNLSPLIFSFQIPTL